MNDIITEKPTGELRFSRRYVNVPLPHLGQGVATSELRRILQQRWSIQKAGEIPTYEWRDVPEAQES